MNKILINGLQLDSKNTGVQYYAQNLYQEMCKSIPNTFNIHLHCIPHKGTPNLIGKRYGRVFYENTRLPTYLSKNNYTLFHSPNYVLPYFITTPSVLTVHDVLAIERPRLCQDSSVVYHKLLMGRSIRKAAKIIAVSNTVKQDILRHFNVPEAKIQVIYNGVSAIFKKTLDPLLLRKYSLPENYVLFTGNIEPKKNLERLIRAFHILKKDTSIPHKLVITGKKGWKYNGVFKTVEELVCGNEIIFTGYVPESDLPALFSMASLFAFPSLYEGFGIPPLEAMACEVPVLVSNKGALPEVTGGKCLQVNPYNVEDIAMGMYKLLTNHQLRERTILEGKGWANQFTWKEAASKTIKLFERVLDLER